MRAALVALPDGTGRFEDFCDGDGILEDGDKEDRPFWVRMRVDKRGDRMTVDFAGTDPQVPGPMNAPLAVTASGVYTGVKMVVDPDNHIPPNSGCWRAIAVQAPAGTVVNARCARAGRLREPRDVPPRLRHALRRARRAPARPGHGVLAGHLGHPHPRRHRPPQPGSPT